MVKTLTFALVAQLKEKPDVKGAERDKRLIMAAEMLLVWCPRPGRKWAAIRSWDVTNLAKSSKRGTSMNKIRRAFLPGIAVALFFPFVSTAAEESGMTGVFEEIVVTARKREETAQSVPIPITAVSEEVMETRNIIEVRDLEKLSPNTSIQYSAVNGSASEVFIRGIGQVNWSSTQDPKIGIYVDGVYISRPQGGLFDLWDVERVEILRGPQGTLFGRNTTAGLIHIVNKKPGFEREFDMQVGMGSDDHRTLGLTANVPVSDQLAFRFSVYDKQTDGFIDNVITGEDRGNENSTTYRASVLWEVEQFSAQASFDRFEADERGPLGSCRFTGPANPFAALSTDRDSSIDTTPDESTGSEVNAYALNLSYDFGWAELTSITAYREIENFNGTWGWVMGNGRGANFLEIVNNESENEIFSQELRLSGSTDRLDWVIGAYFFEEKSEESIDVPLFRDVQAPSPLVWPFFYVPTGGINPDGSPQTLGSIALATQTFGSRTQAYDVTNQNRAVFGELTYSITEQFDATLGVRYTKDDRDFTRIQTLYGGAFDPGYLCPGMPTVQVAPGFFIPTSDRCTQDVDYDKITPRAILSYQLSDDVMFYASYSIGYSSGGFNQDARMRPFLPETSDNWEVGIKSMLLDGRLRLNATGFYNTYENQQLTVGRIVEGQPTADLINAQEAVIWGLELEMLARLGDSLTLAVTAGHRKGDYKEFTVEDNLTDPITLAPLVVTRDLSDTGFGSRDGKALSADISLLHSFQLADGGEIRSSIGFNYTDTRWYTLVNTPSSRVGDYWISDLRITWHLANDKTSISLWGTNIFDEVYVDTMLNQSGDVEIGGIDPSLGMSADYWGEPGRWGVQVRHTF